MPKMFFETADDGLAAFLLVRECRYAGFGIGRTTNPAPVVTHLFDDAAAKLGPLVSAFVSGEADEVSATAFLGALRHLSGQREDQALRLRRQAESDLMKHRCEDER